MPARAKRDRVPPTAAPRPDALGRQAARAVGSGTAGADGSSSTRTECSSRPTRPRRDRRLPRAGIAERGDVGDGQVAYARSTPPPAIRTCTCDSRNAERWREAADGPAPFAGPLEGPRRERSPLSITTFTLRSVALGADGKDRVTRRRGSDPACGRESRASHANRSLRSLTGREALAYGSGESPRALPGPGGPAAATE